MEQTTKTISAISRMKQETNHRINTLIVLQIVGAVALGVSTFVYLGSIILKQGCPTWALFAGLLVAIAGAGAIWLQSRKHSLSIEHSSRGLTWESPVDVNHWVTTLACRLMIIYAVVLATLVTMTGGLFQSSFAPLLVAVLSTGIMLRLPRSALIITFLLLLFVIVLSFCFYAFAGSQSWFQTIGERRIGTEHYRSATTINLIAAQLLTLIGASDWLKDPVLQDLGDETCDLLGSIIVNRVEHNEAIVHGLTLFKRDAATTVPSCNLSIVHEPSAIFEQAIILNIPYSGQELRQTRGAIVYMTFATHWIDDYFDGCYPGFREMTPQSMDVWSDVFDNSADIRPLRRKMLRRLGICPSWCSDIAFLLGENRFFVDRSNRRIIALACCLGIFCRKDVPRSVRKKLPLLRGSWDGAQLPHPDSRLGAMKRGFHRIVLAAALQQMRDRGAVMVTLQKYVTVVTDGYGETPLEKAIAEFYATLMGNRDMWVIIWGTAKTVLELFDCQSPTFDSPSSEVYSILFAPFMIYQNLADELFNEAISVPFKDEVLKIPSSVNTLKDVTKWMNQTEAHDSLSCRLLPCVDFFEKNYALLGEPLALRLNRKPQLGALMEIYGNKLPSNLRQAYDRLLSQDKYW
jgi:hypothetical protein